VSSERRGKRYLEELCPALQALLRQDRQQEALHLERATHALGDLAHEVGIGTGAGQQRRPRQPLLLQHPVDGLARRAVRQSHLAEEIVQEAFVAVWPNPAGFDRDRGSVFVADLSTA